MVNVPAKRVRIVPAPAESSFQFAFGQTELSDDWIQRRNALKNMIATMPVSVRPGGSLDAANWQAIGRAIDAAIDGGGGEQDGGGQKEGGQAEAKGRGGRGRSSTDRGSAVTRQREWRRLGRQRGRREQVHSLHSEIAITVAPALTASSASAVSSLAESVVARLGRILSVEA